MYYGSSSTCIPEKYHVTLKCTNQTYFSKGSMSKVGGYVTQQIFCNGKLENCGL
jgi:hypothetical protein